MLLFVMRELRGCYWQTVPPHWGGGRLFGAAAGFFFTKTGVTRKRKVDKWIRRCQIGCPGSRPEACLAWSQHKNVTYWVSSHESNKKFGPFQKKWMLGHCSVVSWRPCRSFLGPKLAQKSDFFTLHLYDPPFQSSIIIIVFYLTVLHGIALLASARKTPIYFTIYYYTT